MSYFDHIVIGAGINGSSAAYQLAKRGTKVLLLEKFPLPHSRGSSHGQSRIIRKAYPDPFFSNLMKKAYQEWHLIEEELGVHLIKETGLLCFSEETDNIFMKNVITSFEKTPGSTYSVFDGKDFETKFPYLNLEDTIKGCYDPTGGVLLADKALRAVQDLAVKYGAKILDGFEVEDIKSYQNYVEVSGNGGVLYRAKSCVICPGPWASSLLSLLGVTLPLQPVKIPVYYWQCRSFLPHTWIYDTQGRHVYGLPSIEYPGMVKICLHDGVSIHPDTRDSQDTSHLKTFIQDTIKRKFPGVDPMVSVEESCIYTMTPDENPVIDTVPGKENIVVGVGFSGTGFKLGPVTGSMLADMAMGLVTKQPVEILSIDRFRQAQARL